MKHLLAYVIWNKVNMLEWLIDGIVDSFNPNDVDLLFVLDNPIDGTDTKLIELMGSKLNKFNVRLRTFNEETYKFPCQNMAMNVALAFGYKSVICPQDDQKITDKNLIANINKAFGLYGEKLGCIGFRDGFDYGYQNMISSEWSESTLSTRQRLNNGETKEVTLINDGGICYPLHLIKAIGYNDVETFKRFYIEDDYAQRGHNAGFINIVMGNSLIHDRTLSSVASTHYEGNIGETDLKAFKAKWNK